ncbi:MAG: tyrosine-type recombinase/integrase [Acidimicrobiales bacterium]
MGCLTSVEHSKNVGAYIDANKGRETFAEYAERWRANQVHRPTTAERVEGVLRRHVYPSLGAKPLASIRQSDVQAFVRRVSDTLAPSTTELVYRYVVTILRAAVADQLIASMPTARVKLPKAQVRRVVPLELAQVHAVIDAMPERYRALVVLAAGTGLRQGEAFGVTVDRVDFLRRTLVVDRQIVLTPHVAPVLAPPKTDASTRTVPLPTVVTEALAAHLAKFPPGDNGLIFTSAMGEPLRRTKFSETWRAAVKAAGVPDANFHGLRHFYASMLIRSGCSVKVVQARLGHATATETLDTYSHLWPDDEDRTRAAVDGLLGTSRVTVVSRSASDAR